jgi:hypothetical protein
MFKDINLYVDMENQAKTYNKASDVISKNESAVVLFTRGSHFNFDSIGNGESGKWVLNPDQLETIDRVIIYLRDDEKEVNKIFLANYSGYRKSDDSRRIYVRFSKIHEVGIAGVNWVDFAESGQNPVSYVINYY